MPAQAQRAGASGAARALDTPRQAQGPVPRRPRRRSPLCPSRRTAVRLLRLACDLGHVVPGALHGPDRVAVRAEGRGRVSRAARVDEDGNAVAGDDEPTDVVVVVMLAVVPALDDDGEAVEHPGDAPGRAARRSRAARSPWAAGEPRAGRSHSRSVSPRRSPAEPFRLGGGGVTRAPVRGRVPPRLARRRPGARPGAARATAGRQAGGPAPSARLAYHGPPRCIAVREGHGRAQAGHGPDGVQAASGGGARAGRGPRGRGRRRSTSTRSPRRSRRRREAPRRTGQDLRARGRITSARSYSRAGSSSSRRAATSTFPSDPRVPVVHVAVEAEPVPVAPCERTGRARARGASCRIRARKPGYRASSCAAEHLVGPGELGDGLAGAEVEVRVGHRRPGRCRAGQGRRRGRASTRTHCSHSSTMPSATSSIQRSSRVTAAATTARLSRSCRAKRGLLPRHPVAVAVDARRLARPGLRPGRGALGLAAARMRRIAGPSRFRRRVPGVAVLGARHWQRQCRAEEQRAQCSTSKAAEPSAPRSGLGTPSDPVMIPHAMIDQRGQ